MKTQLLGAHLRRVGARVRTFVRCETHLRYLYPAEKITPAKSSENSYAYERIFFAFLLCLTFVLIRCGLFF